MKRLFAVIILLLPLISHAQKETYPVAVIPETIRKGSDAVIREYRREYIYHSAVSASDKVSAVITVMAEKGEDAAAIYIATSMFSDIKSFSGEILDSSGRSLKKLRKSDLSFTDYFSGLASDTRTWYYYPESAYPYTIKYEYEITYKDGILCMPTYAPIKGYNTGVESSEYVLNMPDDMKIHIKTLNSDIEPVVENIKKRKVYSWKFKGLSPMEYEPFSPEFRNVFPIVYIAPHDFTYNKRSGTMDSWHGYSKWQWSLLEGRDILPKDCKEKVKELTASARSDREIIEILYKYLGETRYVSMQIGIGGFQPMSATEVYNNKYGDCKGLSNYMMALLSECGIRSYYTEIGMGETRLMNDYVHPTLTNHAILYVSLEEGDLWIECTNPSLPLGYVHKDISDRKALVYRNGTAELTDMPSYPDSLNVSEQTVTAKIDMSGTITAHIKTKYSMAEYEDIMGFDKMSSSAKLKHAGRDVKLTLAEITDISYTEKKDSSPWGEVSYNLTGRINNSGVRGIIPANPFRDNPTARLRRGRTRDIYIRNGFCNRDNISIEIPEGYSVESTPAPLNLENRFGYFKMSVSREGNVIRINRRMQFNRGTYPAEYYAELKALLDIARDGNNANIVIIKE